MPVPFHLRDAMHVINQLHVASPLLDIPPCKHALLRADHHFRWQACHLAEESRVIYKARDIAGYESVHHTAHADHFAGEDSGIDCGF